MDTKATLACIVSVLGLAIGGCSNGPTAPTTSSTTVVNGGGVTPGPAPAPPSPAPAPAPPAPSPTPTPAPSPTPAPAPAPPAPAPSPIAVYAAVTGSAQWTTPPAPIPDRFTVEVFEETVTFGPLKLKVTSRNTIGKDVVGIMAADETVTIVMERVQVSDSWRWQLSGKPGQAFGYMTAAR